MELAQAGGLRLSQGDRRRGPRPWQGDMPSHAGGSVSVWKVASMPGPRSVVNFRRNDGARYEAGRHTHNSPLITGLNPFTLAYCGPSAPCVRFMTVVTFGHATLGIQCLARASQAGTYPRLTGPSFAMRSRNCAEFEALAASLVDSPQIIRYLQAHRNL